MKNAYDKPELPDYLYIDGDGRVRQIMDWVEADEHPELYWVGVDCSHKCYVAERNKISN